MGKLSPLHDKFSELTPNTLTLLKVITNTGVLHRIFQNNRSNLKNKGIIIWVGGGVRWGEGLNFLPPNKTAPMSIIPGTVTGAVTHTHVLKEAACLRSIDKCSLPRAH